MCELLYKLLLVGYNEILGCVDDERRKSIVGGGCFVGEVKHGASDSLLCCSLLFAMLWRISR